MYRAYPISNASSYLLVHDVNPFCQRYSSTSHRRSLSNTSQLTWDSTIEYERNIVAGIAVMELRNLMDSRAPHIGQVITEGFF